MVVTIEHGAGIGATAVPGQVRQGRLGRFGPLLFLAQFGWTLPGAASGTLLQAVSAEISPTDKVGFYATATTIGAVLAVLTMIVAGALSARTRCRFGPRRPWVVWG